MEEFEGKRKIKKKGVEQVRSFRSVFSLSLSTNTFLTSSSSTLFLSYQPLRKSLQYQTLLLPSGLFANVSGAWRPSISPSTIYSLSNLIKRLIQHSLRHKSENLTEYLCIYSNTGSGESTVHLGPFAERRKSDGTTIPHRAEELANNEMENTRKYVDLEVEEVRKVWGLLKGRRNTVVSGRAAFLFRQSRVEIEFELTFLLLPSSSLLFSSRLIFFRSTQTPTASSSSPLSSSRTRDAVSHQQGTRRVSSSRLHRPRSRSTFTTRYRSLIRSVGKRRRLRRGYCDLSCKFSS